MSKLSPGLDHLKVPSGVEENLRYREGVLARAESDAGYQAELVETCRNDILFWIDTFCWQMNPLKLDDEPGPFVTRPLQRKVIPRMVAAVERRKTLLVEKSREEGGTYLVLLLMVWLCGFRRNKNCLVISRNKEAVQDPKNPNCIFWKIDYLLRHMPAWLIPFDPEENRLSMTFEFPATESYINGTASTSKAGVGGRASLVLADEFAQIDEAVFVATRTAHTADSRIIVSTHTGVGTEFERMCSDPSREKVVMHWTDNPEKAKGMYEFDPGKPTVPLLHDRGYAYPDGFRFVLDGTPAGGPRPGVRSPWYDEKCHEIGTAFGVAQDLDINPSGSASQFFDALVIRRLVAACRPPDWRGELKYDRDSGEPEALCESADGIVRLWRRPDVYGKVPPAPYVAGTDVSTGAGATRSCLAVADARTGEKVCEVQHLHMNEREWATLVIALCRTFADEDGRPAKLVWEKAGSAGSAFQKRAAELRFWNVYYHVNTDGAVPVPSDNPGFYVSPKTKGLLLKDYKVALGDGSCVNLSEGALLSTLAFREGRSGEPEHPFDGSTGRGRAFETGKDVDHGDQPIADALMWLLVLKAGLRKASQSRPAREEETPFGSFGWRRRQRELAAADADAGYYED